VTTTAVELTPAVRVRTDPGHAAELTARLLESFEDTLGVTLTARPGTRVVELAPPALPAVRIEAGARRVLVRGSAVPLTRLEFELLLFLSRHPDVVFDRPTSECAPITTIRGVGYRFDASAEVTVV
jgi:DNA-binding response OmpR family regulator